MFADVRCDQESISKQPWNILPAAMVVLPAVTHAFRRVRPAVTTWLIVSSQCISLGAVSNVMWINNHSEIFLELKPIMQRFDDFCLSINIFFDSK